MKGLIKGLILLVVLLAAIVYLSSGWILVRATEAALPRVERMLAEHGIELSDVTYGKVGLGGLTSAVWKDVEAVVALPAHQSGRSRERFRVRIGAVAVKPNGLSFEEFQLSAIGLEAQLADRLSSDFDWASERFQGAASNGRLRAALVRFEISVDRSDPRPDLRHIYQQLTRLIREGVTTLPATIYAGVHTQLDGKPIGVRLKAVETGGQTVLEVDRDDLARQAEHFNRPLTDAEIEVVAANPLRAPRMLFFKKYAEATAADAREADASVPEDAYRHVLWSYLLAREYGPEFAEQVTDAHEIGSTTNTEADHRMDYNNNAVGRRWAAEEVAESEILARVKSDRNIIRTPV